MLPELKAGDMVRITGFGIDLDFSYSGHEIGSVHRVAQIGEWYEQTMYLIVTGQNSVGYYRDALCKIEPLCEDTPPRENLERAQAVEWPMFKWSVPEGTSWYVGAADEVTPIQDKWHEDVRARQLKKGVEKYGLPLTIDGDADPFEQAIEEVYDLEAYLTRAREQFRRIKDERDRAAERIEELQKTVREARQDKVYLILSRYHRHREAQTLIEENEKFRAVLEQLWGWEHIHNEEFNKKYPDWYDKGSLEADVNYFIKQAGLALGKEAAVRDAS